MPKEGRNQGNVTTKGQTALVAGDFALGAGWGASTVAVTAGSNDHFGSIVITAATGGGLAQAACSASAASAGNAIRARRVSMAILRLLLVYILI